MHRMLGPAFPARGSNNSQLQKKANGITYLGTAGDISNEAEFALAVAEFFIAASLEGSGSNSSTEAPTLPETRVIGPPSPR